MTTGRVYQRDADVLRVIDGDTLLCRVDLGWRAALKAEIRVLGVDAPDDEPARGLAALFVENLLKRSGGPWSWPVTDSIRLGHSPAISPL